MKTYATIIYLVIGCFFIPPPSKILAQCAKYEPPDGNILLVIGQDFNATGKSIYGAGYCDDASLGVTAPAGVTTYAGTGLGVGQGITSMVDYGGGPLYANLYALTPYYNNSVIVMGLYMVNDLGNITSGSKNAELDAIGNWIKSVSPRPVYLRIGYEFDYQYGCCAAQYVLAWQYIVNRFRTTLNVTNVAYVWQAASGAGTPAFLLQWYPGDSYVDWMAYSHFYNNSGTQSAGILNLARSKRKPVMIAESTPYGYRLEQSAAATSAWTNYFAPLFSHINNNTDVIKALCYINQDWDAQSLWAGQGWGNSKIQSNGNGTIKANWIAEVTKPNWLQGTPSLFGLLQNSNTQQPFGGTARSIPGTIQSEDFDTGCEGVSYHDNSFGNSGGSVYRYGYSVDMGATADVSGGNDVGWTATGEWMEYTVNIAASGLYDFSFRVSTINSGNTFHIEQDGVNVSGTIAVPNTGSWTTYTNVTTNNISLTAGIRMLRIYFDNTAGFNINYFTVNSPLPLVFIDFNAEEMGKGVFLSWITSQEVNNKIFEVQRAHQPSGFFETIGKVMPVRGSGNLSSYIFNDSIGLNGVCYYKIKQVDLDGKFTFSEVRSISIGAESNITAFPNPFENEITVETKSVEGSMKVSISDMLGKIIYEKYFFQEKIIFGKELTPGLYIMMTENNGNKEIIKIEKR